MAWQRVNILPERLKVLSRIYLPLDNIDTYSSLVTVVTVSPDSLVYHNILLWRNRGWIFHKVRKFWAILTYSPIVTMVTVQTASFIITIISGDHKDVYPGQTSYVMSVPCPRLQMSQDENTISDLPRLSCSKCVIWPHLYFFSRIYLIANFVKLKRCEINNVSTRYNDNESSEDLGENILL